MALFYEPTDQFAQKVLDGADIVREAMLRQLSQASSGPSETAHPLLSKS